MFSFFWIFPAWGGVGFISVLQNILLNVNVFLTNVFLFYSFLYFLIHHITSYSSLKHVTSLILWCHSCKFHSVFLFITWYLNISLIDFLFLHLTVSLQNLYIRFLSFLLSLILRFCFCLDSVQQPEINWYDMAKNLCSDYLSYWFLEAGDLVEGDSLVFPKCSAFSDKEKTITFPVISWLPLVSSSAVVIILNVSNFCCQPFCQFYRDKISEKCLQNNFDNLDPCSVCSLSWNFTDSCSPCNMWNRFVAQSSTTQKDTFTVDKSSKIRYWRRDRYKFWIWNSTFPDESLINLIFVMFCWPL